MIRDSYYSAPVGAFLTSSNDAVLGELTRAHHHALEHQQRDAWLAQIDFLKDQLAGVYEGHLFLEFSIPRMGKRADAVLLLNGLVYVVEFKVHAVAYDRYAIDQVHD